MEIRIETLAPVTVAHVRRRGPYPRSAPAAWAALWRWVDEHGLAASVGQGIGFGHHNPQITPPQDQVYDACLEIAGDLTPDAVAGRQILPGGRYAILRIEGPIPALARASSGCAPGCRPRTSPPTGAPGSRSTATRPRTRPRPSS